MKKALFTTLAVIFTSTMVMANEFDNASADPCSTGAGKTEASKTDNGSSTTNPDNLLDAKK